MRCKKKKTHRVLACSCTHNPFMKQGYVDFLKKVWKQYKCDTFVHCGDEVDHHIISFHTPEPEADGAREEHKKAVESLKPLYKAFPKAKVCLSNHSTRPTRKGASVGIPDFYFRTLKEVLEAPNGWEWADEWIIDGVHYIHGEPFSGNTPHLTAARTKMASVVMGHIHQAGGVEYVATADKRIFGMCVGTGVDHKAYAFKYAKNAKLKSMIGCGVIIGGKQAIFIPMELEHD